MKRKNPPTSTDAYRSLEPDKIRDMYKRIANDLKENGPGTYEQIANRIGEKPERVWKRLSECLKLGLCYRNGDRRMMTSGRQGFVWVFGSAADVTQKRKRVMKGPTVSQFSKAILNQPKLSDNTINRLF